MKTIWILDGLMTVIGSLMVMGGAFWIWLKMSEEKYKDRERYRVQLEKEFKEDRHREDLEKWNKERNKKRKVD